MFLVVLLDVVQELLALADLDVGGKADFFESLTQNQLYVASYWVDMLRNMFNYFFYPDSTKSIRVLQVHLPGLQLGLWSFLC